ncbi:MAG: beta galactosidase jelly roll domain-containing protein [Bacteroidota bacterium]
MRVVLFLLLFYVPPVCGFALQAEGEPNNDWQRIVDLRGTWQFRLGDNLSWATAADDGAWESIFVPAAWEDEGFWGYDGFAWYRTTFQVRPADAARTLFLHLGRVDDVDEVWINGHFVGSTGRLGPAYETGYHSLRIYRVPSEYLRTRGDNVLTVRVYDDELGGGIVEGRVGIYAARNAPEMEVDLAGAWQFQPGDDRRWSAPGFDDRNWNTITVPGRWEQQGYWQLDGFAWYRTSFTLKDWEGDSRVLVLGLVDDLDEAFVNGQRVGGTGRIDRREVRGDEWQDLRAYTIPADVLREGTNTVAVRVYDGWVDGGIHRGPVGLMQLEAFERWREQDEGGIIGWFRSIFQKNGWD